MPYALWCLTFSILCRGFLIRESGVRAPEGVPVARACRGGTSAAPAPSLPNAELTNDSAVCYHGFILPVEGWA